MASPHLRNKRRTPDIMKMVIFALIPGVAVQGYFSGGAVYIQLLLAILTAVLTEAAFLKMRNRPISNSIKDYSAVLTGILLAIAIPSFAPWWVIVMGTAFAIIVVKQLYGGLGQNIFNPAMAGYVLLLISFPVEMTTWVPAYTINFSLLETFNIIFTGSSEQGITLAHRLNAIDGMTAATPLEGVRTALYAGKTISEMIAPPLFSLASDYVSQWVNLAFLIGGLFLLKMRVILWHIPTAFIAGMFVFSFTAFAFDADLYSSPLHHLFTGATMLGAFFILTDPVTASTTTKGRILYGLLCALLVVVIRNLGGYPDAVAFAVLLANMCVPLIDYYTKPVVYGRKKA